MKNSFRKLLILILFFLTGNLLTLAQDQYPRMAHIDVLKYVFQLELRDENNVISGEARATILVKDKMPIRLDLVGKNGEFGMQIMEVREDDREIDFTFSENKITFEPSSTGEHIYQITYEGIPERGLVISQTKFGQRSFFGDNWPNLARHWLPAVDHPYDKAAIGFNIIAPAHYDVVATGKKIEESYLDQNRKLTRYQEDAPVPMKVVTIGVTRFAYELLGTIDDIEVSAWVYPENRLDGFGDYAVATEVLHYFIENIGPYSYAKLANMQAKTQWGGLENAGTIAYFENSVTGKKTVENLIAHEVAHQWFGNSASEADWNHVWLSEGFATYFTILYVENKYGIQNRNDLLLEDRGQIIEYYKKTKSPVVDPSITDPMKVLSTNTYQKGGWVLHMLRMKMGDEAFWKGIRNYYSKFRNNNALTSDFQHVMEEASGIELEDFFRQWIFTAGHPQIAFNWKHKKGKVEITITQSENVFNFPLQIGIVYNDGSMEVHELAVDEQRESMSIDVQDKPADVVLDPEMRLLFEEK